MNASKKFRAISPVQISDSGGILDERLLILIFQTMKWDLQMLCTAASVNRKLRAIAERILWRELCFNRAPKISAALTNGASHGRVGGGWQALAKLMFFCCGCQSSRQFRVSQTLPGHFVHESRFSKTSGRSFLTKKCRGDLLYVSDPCEHSVGSNEDDLGVYRGVFRGFMKSKTRAYLIRRQVRLEERIRCPYCGARVWSMTSAKLVPKSAARRLGTHDGRLEYFVCVNGHLHGSCWLVPLSSDSEEEETVNSDEDEEESEGEDDYYRQIRHRQTESTSSMGEERNSVFLSSRHRKSGSSPLVADFS